MDVIASCTKCQTRFRLADDKIGPGGAKIRCSKCQTVFRVGGPDASAPTTERPAVKPVAAAAPPTKVLPKPAARPAPKPVPKEPPPPLGRVLVAEPDAAVAKQVVEFLKRWRLEADVREDGAEALLDIYRHPPMAVVLGGHLPGVSAPKIAEIVRRTAALQGVKLVRVAPIDEPAAPPEFEANRTLEPGDLPEGLGEILAALRLGEPPPAAPRPAPRQGSATGERTAPVRRPAPSSDPGVAAAERLARIIVSDIILYNDEAFREGAAAGDVVGALEAQIIEASVLFRQRIPESVRAQRDFIAAELERRAQALG